MENTIENDKDFQEFKKKLLEENTPKKKNATPPKRRNVNHIAKTIKGAMSNGSATPKQVKARKRAVAARKARNKNRKYLKA